MFWEMLEEVEYSFTDIVKLFREQKLSPEV